MYCFPILYLPINAVKPSATLHLLVAIIDLVRDVYILCLYIYIDVDTLYVYLIYIYYIYIYHLQLSHLLKVNTDTFIYPDSNNHGANMGPTCVLSTPGGPHGGPMNLAVRVI